jgi:hypothetical protein
VTAIRFESDNIPACRVHHLDAKGNLRRGHALPHLDPAVLRNLDEIDRDPSLRPWPTPYRGAIALYRLGHTALESGHERALNDVCHRHARRDRGTTTTCTACWANRPAPEGRAEE